MKSFSCNLPLISRIFIEFISLLVNPGSSSNKNDSIINKDSTILKSGYNYPIF